MRKKSAKQQPKMTTELQATDLGHRLNMCVSDQPSPNMKLGWNSTTYIRTNYKNQYKKKLSLHKIGT